MSESRRRFKGVGSIYGIGGILLSLSVGAMTLLQGCAGGKRTDIVAELTSARIPQAILIEREISGDIKGRPKANPTGVAVNQLGEIFITDTGNNRVLKFDSSFELKAVIGGYGAGSNLFNEPTFISDDNRLNLLVSDRANRRIARYSSQLVYVDEIEFSNTAEPLQYGAPSGLAVTSYGEMWVADIERNRLAVFDNSGRFDRFVGDFGDQSGQMASPEKIITTPESEFLVCDAGNSRLVFFDQYGSFVRQIKIDAFDYPMAAAVVRNGIWVVDANREELFLLDRRGNELFKAGPMLTGSATTLRGPTDIVELDSDRLLICDSGNSRLLVCRVLYEEE